MEPPNDLNNNPFLRREVAVGRAVGDPTTRFYAFGQDPRLTLPNPVPFVEAVPTTKRGRDEPVTGVPVTLGMSRMSAGMGRESLFGVQTVDLSTLSSSTVALSTGELPGGTPWQITGVGGYFVPQGYTPPASLRSHTHFGSDSVETEYQLRSPQWQND